MADAWVEPIIRIGNRLDGIEATLYNKFYITSRKSSNSLMNQSVAEKEKYYNDGRGCTSKTLRGVGAPGPPAPPSS